MTGSGEAELRVLVVDDDADQRLVLRQLLRRAGVSTVAEAADGDHALSVARDGRFGLIVLDVTMPGRSGLEVLPELCELAGDAPIVMLSSLPRHRTANLAVQRGAVGYVEKNVGPDRLVDEIFLAAAITVGASDLVSADLPGDTGAAVSARRFVREHLGSVGGELVATAELLVSELVTNAVVHASSAPRVDVRLSREAVRVEVHDDDPTLPAAGLPATSALGGRGLLLVQELSARWGTEPDGTGKVVWFELER